MKKIHVIYMVLALTLAPFALQADEQDQVNQAATIMAHFKALPEKGIPSDILRNAKGFAILTIAKGGFVFSGKIGEGVVVARTEEGWSGPSFIRTGGAGFGPQIGGE
jgi:lipid-binding SYLF domain-containing protein